MNILVIGGGGQPGRFGKDFCDRARVNGHSVYVISHRDYGTGDPKQISADFNNPSSVVDAFRTVMQGVDHLDIMLYNSSAYGYPNNVNSFQSTAQVDIQKHYLNYNVYVLCPHLLSIEALKIMNKNSKIIFLTTGLTLSWMWEEENSDFIRLAGYTGGKSFQNHLMIALANHNDKEVTVTSLSPHFDYKNIDAYKRSLELTYNRILNVEARDNGKIRPVR
jgi:NAD(P)-dependent dehydrogenase (short-subunit alcohol dehydrogenase family)